MGGFHLNNDWNRKGQNVQIQQIIKVDDTFGATLSTEMLEYLKVVVGEDVQIEMKDHELIIRKIIPYEPPEGFTEDFFRTLNDKFEGNNTTLKSLKK